MFRNMYGLEVGSIALKERDTRNKSAAPASFDNEDELN